MQRLQLGVRVPHPELIENLKRFICVRVNVVDDMSRSRKPLVSLVVQHEG